MTRDNFSKFDAFITSCIPGVSLDEVRLQSRVAKNLVLEINMMKAFVAKIDL